MKTSLALISLLIATVTVLTACGGGEAGGGVNPLERYAGIYYQCDGNTKQTITVTAQGSDSIAVAFDEKIFDNDNCAGAVVGALTYPSPLTIRYTGKMTAKMPNVTILPFSDTVDAITSSTPSMTQQLSGTGVDGLCVNFSNGQTCYDDLSVAAQTVNSAIYLTGNYFVFLDLTDDVLMPGDILSRDAAFNFSSLVAR